MSPFQRNVPLSEKSLLSYSFPKVVIPITGIGNSKKKKKQKTAFLHFFIGSCVKTCWRCHCSRFNWGDRRNTETGTYSCPRLLTLIPLKTISCDPDLLGVYWAWSSIPQNDSLESNRATDNDLKLYKVQIRHKKTKKTLLFSVAGRGGEGESDAIQDPSCFNLAPKVVQTPLALSSHHLLDCGQCRALHPLRLLRQRWTNKCWDKPWPRKTVSLISMNSFICIVSKGCLSLQDIFGKLTENGCFLI